MHLKIFKPDSTTQVSCTGVGCEHLKILCSIRRPGEINGDPPRMADLKATQNSYRAMRLIYLELE